MRDMKMDEDRIGKKEGRMKRRERERDEEAPDKPEYDIGVSKSIAGDVFPV